MATWLADYRERFENSLHALLWRQWTILGVAGAGATGALVSPIDPEALLLITLESTRTEPRLFDEVLDWLGKHGRWLDIQRVRNFLRRDADGPTRLVQAVAALLAEEDSSLKWKRLANPPPPPPAVSEPLFLLPGNAWLAEHPVVHSLFARYGYRRPRLERRGLTGPIPMRLAGALRFRLRALFGIGLRSEALAFLISGGSGNAKEVSEAAGYSPLGTQLALRELVQSETIRVQPRGRERVYVTDALSWWEFLKVERRTAAGRVISTPAGLAFQDDDIKPLKDSEGRVSGWSQDPLVTWSDWRSQFQGLARVLRFLRRADLPDLTPYAGDSELRRIIQASEPDLTSTGSAYRPPPADASPREHGEQLLSSIRILAGVDGK